MAGFTKTPVPGISLLVLSESTLLMDDGAATEATASGFTSVFATALKGEPGGDTTAAFDAAGRVAQPTKTVGIQTINASATVNFLRV
jgi:hypothetical protein